MENSFQTSFIPKKPIINNGTSPSNNKMTSISMVVSFSILVVVVLLAGGLFFYKDYLTKNRETLSDDLSKIKDSFDKNTISELELYDNRMTIAKQVLSGHIVLSPLFELLNEITLSSIQYTDFSHETEDGIFSVKMSGIASDYKSIALQADSFGSTKGNNLKNVIFSNLTKDKNNYVTFDLDFNVDSSLLSYSNNITNKESSGSGIISNEENIQTSNNPDQLLIETDNTQ